MGCPVCGELWVHHPQCPETEDIRVLEALQVGDLTEALVKAARDVGLDVEKKGDRS